MDTPAVQLREKDWDRYARAVLFANALSENIKMGVYGEHWEMKVEEAIIKYTLAVLS
jgi:hypothetical protein